MKKLLVSIALCALALSGQAQIQHSELMEQPLPEFRGTGPALLPAMTLTLGGQVGTTNSTTDTNSHTGFWGTLWTDVKPVFTATNYAFESYGTYAPSAPKGSQWGGGIMAVYNLNQNVGPGVGVDYLGHFSLMSASVTLRMPIRLNSLVNVSWLSNVVVIPFVAPGLGASFSGSGSAGTPVTTVNAGGVIEFGHVLGGKFNIGADYGEWFNAGPYSGKRYHFLAGLDWGF